jgi:hypothetical protein
VCNHGSEPFREQADVILMCVALMVMVAIPCWSSRRLPQTKQPNLQTFTVVRRRLADTGTLTPVAVDRGSSGREYPRTCSADPGFSMSQLAAAFPVGHLTVQGRPTP